MSNTLQNVVIIGGGPAGLSAALYLARANMSPLVFAGSPPGGQLMLTSEIENFPGRESILGSELIDVMRKQVKNFGTTIRDENVTSVKLSEAIKTVNDVQAKAVIIATGAKALWLGLESETRLRGKGVSACATCDGFFFKNKVVAVIGGGDTALEEALTLTKFASKVYIVHRRTEFKASKIMQKRVLEHEKIEVIWSAAVAEVVGQFKVEGVKLTVPAGEKTLKVDGVFVAIGHRPDTDLFKEQIALDKKGYILTSSMYALAKAKDPQFTTEGTFNFEYQTMTSLRGVFAAGDCVDHIYKQASTAAGLGVGASLDAERWIESY